MGVSSEISSLIIFRTFWTFSSGYSILFVISSGEYVLKVAFGKDWNVTDKRFNYRKSFSKTQTFIVEERTWTESVNTDEEVTRTRASKISITLHKVPHGNFKSHPIDEDEFWK